MKKKLLLAIPALALVGLAHAQSNVTLYGVADAGFVNAKSPNGRVTLLKSGSQNSSRWGIRGSEELSKGLTAKFNLESSYDIDTGVLGQGGLLFGRRATVGLSGGFGGVELGRRDSPMTNLLDALEPSGAGNNFGINDILRNQATRGYQRRYNNQIRYETPSLAGFNGAAMYSLGEANTLPGTTKTRNDTFGFNATYTGGPLFGGIAYNRSKDDGGPATGAVTSVTPHKFRTAGASYDFGVVKLFAFGYSDKRSGAVLSPEINQRMASGGIQVPFAGNQVVAASYARIKDKVDRSTGHADARHISLTYLYTLSKRTNFYANYGHVKNDNYVPSANARNGFTYLSTGLIQDDGKSQGWAVGVRHLF